MANTRTCCICNRLLQNRRRDAKTCSSSCRSKLFRSNRNQTVLVKFRVPQTTFTDLAIKAFSANQSIDEYLTQLVVANE